MERTNISLDLVAEVHESKNISRRLSTWSVMQVITNCGPISRASISKQTGLSKQTVSEIVSKLGDDNWVSQTGRTKGHIGRTAVTYELVPDAAYVASVDLGGTKVRVAITNLGSNIVGEMSEKTEPRGGIEVAKQIARLCRSLALTHKIDASKLFFAVIGVPGVPEPETGRVLMMPNISGIDELDFTSALEAELGIPVQVENDANLAVLGEHWAGLGADVDNLVYVSLGTGIGAGLIIDGKLVRGAMGAAGELGYLPFGADPFDSQSREVGALERQAGSLGISKRYRELAGVDCTVPEVFDRAEQGDQSAIQTLTETSRLLARLVATICVVVNPSLIILGGSIGERFASMDLIQSALAECFSYPIEIEPSQLKTHAALLGGVAIGLNYLHRVLFADGLAGVDITLPQPVFPLLMEAL